MPLGREESFCWEDRGQFTSFKCLSFGKDDKSKPSRPSRACSFVVAG